ncbi:hypothetical protein QQX98_000437 [Neonectria punicea]|uniref:Uncharacterized protein n=1 Tax=Neonectria punicea TaxID=979145 RepID=A0ABR1HUH7_9HYPO
MGTSTGLELELLHNFTVSTASTFSLDPSIRTLWRVDVPKIGFSTPYILNGIMALSALHMARFDQGRRTYLLNRSTQYQTASLKEALPLIPSITTQNCSHLFLFGVLTLLTNLASPIKEDDILVVGSGVVPKWLFLLRGIYALIQAEEKTLRSSAISLIFRATATTREFWSSHIPVENEMLSELEAGIHTRTRNEQAKQDILLEALEALKRSYTFSDNYRFKEQGKLRGVYQWLFAISDGYLKLLKDMDNEALCILAYFSILLRELEKYWWIEGWGVHLIKRIYHMLDDQYRLYIRPAVEEIGWVPEASWR